MFAQAGALHPPPAPPVPALRIHVMPLLWPMPRLVPMTGPPVVRSGSSGRSAIHFPLPRPTVPGHAGAIAASHGQPLPTSLSTPSAPNNNSSKLPEAQHTTVSTSSSSTFGDEPGSATAEVTLNRDGLLEPNWLEPTWLEPEEIQGPLDRP